MGELGLFYVLAFLITACAVMVISARNPVTSAVFLVLDLFLLAGLYAMMEAHFVAVIQVLLYAGAITVLFMFVIMLLNLSPDALPRYKIPPVEMVILILTAVGFIAVAAMIAAGEPGPISGNMTPEAVEEAGGNTFVVGMVLFTKYLWPFELASILILLAIVASVVIAKRDKKKVDAAKEQAPSNRPEAV